MTEPSIQQLLRMAMVMPMDPRNRKLLEDAANKIDHLETVIRAAFEELAEPHGDHEAYLILKNSGVP